MHSFLKLTAPAALIWMSIFAAGENSDDRSASIKPSVKWIKCPKAIPSPIECGEVKVPVDHAHPEGDSITLALTRFRSTSQCDVGQGLYFENGGPGASNSAVPISAAEEASQPPGEKPGIFAELLPIYDIIGLDMRGTGLSTPVHCDAEITNTLTWPLVKDEAAYNKMATTARAFGQSCVNMTGPLAYHMGTDQALEDLELVRQALGHDKLNYLGFSYGTQLGSEYAEKYPQNVGRMVLDGMADRHLSAAMAIITSAIGLESTLNDFFRWCNATSECALHGRNQPAIFDALVERADNDALLDPACASGVCLHNGSVRPWEFVLNTQNKLHSYNDKSQPTDNWYALAQGLKEAHDHNNASFLADDPTTTNTSSSSFDLYPELMITCSDMAKGKLKAADFRNIYIMTSVLAPHTRGYGVEQQFYSVCAGWPIEPSNPPHHLDRERMEMNPPIMLVDSLYDPSTPSMWNPDMRAQIPTGFTIWRNGGGHTSFQLNGETTRAINAFLAHGTIPEDGTIYSS